MTTLGQYFSDVYAPQKMPGCPLRTRSSYLDAIRWLTEFCEINGLASSLEDLNAETLHAWQQDFIERGRSPATANANLRPIAAMLNFAWKKGHISRAPEVVRLPEPQRRTLRWTRAEIERLLAAAAMERGDLCPRIPASAFWIAFIRLTLDTGLRKTRLMNLPPASYWKERSAILDQDETGRTAAVLYLGPHTAAAVERLIPNPTPWLLPWPHDRYGECTWTCFQRHARRLLKSAGLLSDESDGRMSYMLIKSRSSIGAEEIVPRAVPRLRLVTA